MIVPADQRSSLRMDIADDRNLRLIYKPQDSVVSARPPARRVQEKHARGILCLCPLQSG